jgi:hypothetical protein
MLPCGFSQKGPREDAEEARERGRMSEPSTLLRRTPGVVRVEMFAELPIAVSLGCAVADPVVGIAPLLVLSPRIRWLCD